MNEQRKKVFVGLSGGVDSSVAAALLKEAGHDVQGVFIKGWHPDFLSCTWQEDRVDAMRAAAHLKIPFTTLDLEAEYKRDVADYLIGEARAGRTPNPDVMCNKHIKFGAFMNWTLQRGADYIATGHYAQSNARTLLRGADENKDQSYFLWTLTEKQLSRTLFPVGHLTKPQVRELALKLNLPTASKKDSQGVCFLGMLNMKEFLAHYITPHQGEVVDESGTVIGHHRGVEFYTVGERHGFTITKKTPADAPHYILAKDLTTNRLIVSSTPTETNQAIQNITLINTNWTIAPKEGEEYSAQFRYRQEPRRCHVSIKGTAGAVVSFFEPQLVPTGQSLVVYDGNICLGGGVVDG